jgi:hypothetical protein
LNKTMPTNKQTNNQPTNQTNNQTNKQTNKQTELKYKYNPYSTLLRIVLLRIVAS